MTSTLSQPSTDLTFEQWLDQPDSHYPKSRRRDCFSARVCADFKIGWDAALASVEAPTEPSAYLCTRPSGFAWAAMPRELTPEARAAHKGDGVAIEPLFTHLAQAIRNGEVTLSPTDEQIEAMTNRFLSWQLPYSFAPDGGIEFKPAHPQHHWPVGTNLFDAQQARAMVEHIALALKPEPAQQPITAETENSVTAPASAITAENGNEPGRGSTTRERRLNAIFDKERAKEAAQQAEPKEQP